MRTIESMGHWNKPSGAHITGVMDLSAFAPTSEMPVDSGIREYVLILRAAGIETFESCEGGPGHAFSEPTIKFHGNSWEGFRALAIAKTHRLPVSAIRLTWDIYDEMPHGPWWEITFHTTTGGASELI